jgi:hypothetical protein
MWEVKKRASVGSRRRSAGAPTEPVEPYAVLTLARRGPLRAMRSSALLPGRVASSGCWRGGAVVRKGAESPRGE